MQELAEARFEEDVLRADRPVVVDFWAPWCRPCKAVEPILEALAGASDRVRFVRLNVEENPGVASSYDVLSLPTAILFESGEVRQRVIGKRSRSHYERAFAPWLRV